MVKCFAEISAAALGNPPSATMGGDQEQKYGSKGLQAQVQLLRGPIESMQDAGGQEAWSLAVKSP